MFKKFVSLMLVFSIIATLFVVPTTAEEVASFEDSKFFSVDYRTEIESDLIGGLDPVLTVVPTVPTGEYDQDGYEIYDYRYNMVFAEDDTLGVPVADFDGTYSVGYDVDLSKLEKDFTVEAYFKLGSEQNGAPWSQVCGTVWMQAENAGAHGFSLNTSSMALSPRDGAYPGDDVIPVQGPYIGTKKQYMLTWSTGIGGYGCINDSFAGGKKADKDACYDQWVHVVYTFDAEGNEALYYNNAEVFNRKAYADSITHDESNEMSRLFRIAGYNWANNWDMVDMQCAYINLYESAATADEVNTLYTNKDVVSEVVIPTPRPGGSSFDESSLFFDVDFDSQGVEDLTGNFAYEDLESAKEATDLTYEYDAEIGRNVLVLDGDGVLVWRHPDGPAATLNGMDLDEEGLTLEAYVWISDNAGLTNMVILETCDAAVHLQEYNDGIDFCSGFRAGDGTGILSANAYIDSTFPHGRWVHIVGTADGDSNDLYIDGMHYATYARASNILSSNYNTQGEGIYIGESYLGDMWGSTAFYGKIAFARIYKATVTADDVSERYCEVTGEDGGPNVTLTPATPGPTPTIRPTLPPISGGSLEEATFFSVDFDTLGVEDLTGNFVYEAFESAVDAEDLVYEYDEEIGRNVLVLDGEGVLTWRHPAGDVAALNGMNLDEEGLTVESYVWISDDAGMTNMVIIETNDSAVHLQEYNDGYDLCSGFRAGDGTGSDVPAANAYINATFPHGEWVHIVGTADGDSNDLYINGTHRATYYRYSNILTNMHGSYGEGVYIGESYLGSMWGSTAFYGKIAYSKIYKKTATAEEVATIYTDLTGKEPEDAPFETPIDPYPVEEGLVYGDFVYDNYYDEFAVITGYLGNSEDVIVPSYIDDIPVMAIDVDAFYGYTKMKSVTLPGSLFYIASGAFNRCDNLDIVYFSGTESDWYGMAIDILNEPLHTARKVFVGSGYLKEKTTVADYKASLGENFDCVISDKNGAIVKDNAYVGTGMTITVSNKADGSSLIQAAVVFGDVTGDGKVTSLDYMKIKRAVIDEYSLTEWYQFEAADINLNGMIQSNDYLKVKRHFGGVYNIYENL